MLAIQYIVVDGDFKIKCMFARASVQNRMEGKNMAGNKSDCFGISENSGVSGKQM